MMSQKELQKYAEQDYKLVDPEYIKQILINRFILALPPINVTIYKKGK